MRSSGNLYEWFNEQLFDPKAIILHYGRSSDLLCKKHLLPISFEFETVDYDISFIEITAAGTVQVSHLIPFSLH